LAVRVELADEVPRFDVEMRNVRLYGRFIQRGGSAFPPTLE